MLFFIIQELLSKDKTQDLTDGDIYQVVIFVKRSCSDKSGTPVCLILYAQKTGTCFKVGKIAMEIHLSSLHLQQ